MHRRTFTAHARFRQYAGLASTVVAVTVMALCAIAVSTASAQTQPPVRLTLRQAFEAAWAAQPEMAGLAARSDAARAQQQAAQSWTPEPAAVELATKTDRLNRNLGTREYAAGVAIPLWLPGERGRSQALAQAESRAVESRATAAQLRVAASVREAWWNWQRARTDADTARGQLDSAQRIASDVAKRLKAGDLARADQHQADGAVAAAQAVLAQAQASVIVARQQVRTLTASPGLDLESGRTDADASAEADPGATGAAPADIDNHAELLALKDRAAVAEGNAALAATQTRANPELTIGTTRDRGSFGEAWQQTVTVGVRVPFGGGPRHDARQAAARAETIELQAQLNLERARLAGERGSAQARTEAARTQLGAAERRAQLARESRGFFDKSFRMGETDLPTRLRIEAEAAEAERQAARARVELAAAISSWRQALGWLPQ
jgi:outer membrane protein, heavy metal efflux system